MRGLLTLRALALLVCLPMAALCLAEPKAVRVGYLSFSPGETQNFVQQLKDGLAAKGWVEGRNLELIGRHASGEPPSYAAAAKELAGLKPDLIYASGAPPMRALFAETRVIPLLTTDLSSDPIAMGYATSYSRPGKNVAGVFLDAPQIAGKWFDILGAIVPKLKRVAVIWYPDTGPVHLNAARQVAQGLRIRVQIYEVRSIDDVEQAFATIKGKQQAVVILPSPLAYGHGGRMAELTLRYHLPATSMAKGFAEAGGLASYGPNLYELNKRAFALAASILEGVSPSELPIETPTKFDFLINTHTAKKLGVRIPDRFLVGAELVGR